MLYPFVLSVLYAVTAPAYWCVTVYSEGTVEVVPVTWATQRPGTLTVCRDVFGRVAAWHVLAEMDEAAVQVDAGSVSGHLPSPLRLEYRFGPGGEFSRAVISRP